jgi:riboflavin kinase/FMN adenylyltransferase
MKLIRNPGSRSSSSRGSVAALGSFDGFHLGHRKAVSRAVELARHEGLVPTAIVIYRPVTASTVQEAEGALTTLRQLVDLLDAADVESVALVAPSDVGDASIARRLSDSLQLRALVAAGGSDEEVALSESTARRLGVTLEIEPPFILEGAVVSCAAVRSAVRGADLALIKRLIGREYAVCGRVVHGHHRGKGLGIATANLRPRGIELPPDGVYAVWATVGGRKLPGVANVGRKPTFGDLERTIETHILDFDENLYGRLLRVSFVDRLRGEVRFPGVDALLEQIRSDIAQARLVLAGA